MYLFFFEKKKLMLRKQKPLLQQGGAMSDTIHVPRPNVAVSWAMINNDF
jgi:hypothetical protein